MNETAVPARRWRRYASAAFLVTAFGFLGYFVFANVGELRAHEWSLRPTALVASLLLHILGLGWGVAVWGMVLRRTGFRVPYLRLAKVWFVSGLGRYIPGKVWQFVGAAHLGSTAGLPAALTVSTLAVHAGIFLVAAIMTGVYILPIGSAAVPSDAVLLARWIAPLMLVLVHPGVIRGVLAVVSRATRRELADWRGRWIDGVLLVLVASISWLIIGAAFSLFVISLTPVPSGSVLALVAMNALAFVAGYVVFFVPAGLGAKEGALAAMLTILLPTSVAALVAVAARLWTVAAEAVPALFLLALSGRLAGAVPERRDRPASTDVDR